MFGELGVPSELVIFGGPGAPAGDQDSAAQDSVSLGLLELTAPPQLVHTTVFSAKNPPPLLGL